ncbi:MAG: helix-turn-helix domain-containing protein [Treponema sp.]|jgi:hypothetical protein|nr:helix-turn-helix domain-containing protein [Treponema sp.]
MGREFKLGAFPALSDPSGAPPINVKLPDAGCLREWHREQNRKSVIVRQKKAAGRAEELRIYYDSHPGVSRKELAEIFDVSEKTIRRLKIFRKG